MRLLTPEEAKEQANMILHPFSLKNLSRELSMFYEPASPKE